MSEDNNKQSEDSQSASQSADTAVSAESEQESAAAPAATAGKNLAADAPAKPETKRKSGGSSAVGWLALLLVLALAAVAGWTGMQAMEREKNLKRRIGQLEKHNAAENRDFSAELTALEGKLQSRLEGGLEQARAEAGRQSQELSQLNQQLLAHSEQLASFSANDHESWLRAEAQYLLRLANQRVIMARDTESALALLGSADSILRQLDDASLHDVRAAVAAEQAALRAVPKVDVEGIYLRISALIEQADRLVIFQMPEGEAAEAEAGLPEDDWQVRLERGYEEAARKLSDYIVIRRRDVPMHALMDPQWEGLVRQNLRMLLEQAQVALLSGNQTLYVESLERSQHWVAQFFDTDEAAARAMAREISQLEGQRVQVVMPDLTRSLQALDEAVKKRLQQGGAE